jgi:hypothetical protein
MIELAVVIIGLLSAGIFLAHAVEAYQAQYRQPAADMTRPLQGGLET